MKFRNLLLATLAGVAASCTPQTEKVVLPSWNDTPVKAKLMNYLQVEVDKIPVEDRVAVFDMDGTIACERPLWFEMSVAVQRILDLAEQDSSWKNTVEYSYAQRLSVNPSDTTVQNHWVVEGRNYLDSLILKAFAGEENETYVAYAHAYLNKARDKKYDIAFADMFYQPMMELIKELQQKQFQIYIVSGSIQGIVWSVCPQNIGFDREHLLGSRQAMNVSFPKEGPVSYILQKEMLKPRNNHYGKAVNIYNHIGKTPVVAIGNTVGDFGMFHMASCSPYPHLALMLNHDDAEREYAYPPYYSGNPNWQDSIRINNWIQADMSKEFKVVWKQRPSSHR